jgi:hypothetical protein
MFMIYNISMMNNLIIYEDEGNAKSFHQFLRKEPGWKERNVESN